MFNFYWNYRIQKLKKEIMIEKKVTHIIDKNKIQILCNFIHKLTGRRTFCFCPNCNDELIGNNSFVSDEGYVTYKCTNCGELTRWLFDAPCPILLKDN